MTSMGPALPLCVLALLGTASAYPSYVSEVPNGAQFNGGTGHINPNGGGNRNPFGAAFAAGGRTWTKALCELDSDGDGKSNGLELGDTKCVWAKGADVAFTTDISNPGDATSTTARTGDEVVAIPTSAPSKAGAVTTQAPTTAPISQPGGTGEGGGAEGQKASLANQYKQSIAIAGVADADFYWTLDKAGGTLSGAFHIKSTGVASIAFPPEGSSKMDGADALFGGGAAVEAYALGHWLVGTKKADGYLSEASTEVVEGFVTVRFKRALKGASGDVEIPSTGPATLLWAKFGANGPAAGLAPHSTRGAFAVDLSQGGEVVLDKPSGLVSLVPVYIGIGGGALLGLLLLYTPLRCSGLGQMLLQKRLNVGPGFVSEMTYANALGYLWAVGMFVLLFIVKSATQSAIAALGWVVSTAMAMALLPAQRNSVWLYIFGIPFERAVKFHIFFSRTTFLVVFVHLISVLASPISATSAQRSNGVVPLYGLLALITMCVFVPCTIVRRTHFEVFMYSHSLFLLAVIFAVIHAAAIVSRTFLLTSLGLWLVDQGLRFLHTTTAKPTSEVVGDFTVLKIPRNSVRTGPGDYAFVTVPQISRWQQHPFTIASAPHEDTLTFVIKNMGPDTFTGQLHKLASAGSLESIKVETAYGKLSVRLEDYRCLILCAGGIGITPMASILKHLIQAKAQYPQLQKVVLLWTVRTEQELGAFQDLLQQARESEHVQLSVYLTRAKEVPEGYTAGRPDFADCFDKCMQGQDDDASTLRAVAQGCSSPVAVLACGPASQVNAVQMAAVARSWHFHKETFLL